MSARQINFGGSTLVVDGIRVGATTPNSAGTELTGSEIALLDGITAGTATASKAVVLGASKEIATITTATITNLTTTTLTPTTIAGTPNFSGAPTFASTSTFTGSPTFDGDPIIGVGRTVNLDSGTATLVTNAATVTKFASVVTSEALTTAAAATETFVITLTGVAAGDLAFVTASGGTNTRKNLTWEAVTTTNTITVKMTNAEPTNAVNGTVKFNLWVLKA